MSDAIRLGVGAAEPRQPPRPWPPGLAPWECAERALLALPTQLRRAVLTAPARIGQDRRLAVLAYLAGTTTEEIGDFLRLFPGRRGARRVWLG